MIDSPTFSFTGQMTDIPPLPPIVPKVDRGGLLLAAAAGVSLGVWWWIKTRKVKRKPRQVVFAITGFGKFAGVEENPTAISESFRKTHAFSLVTRNESSWRSSGRLLILSPCTPPLFLWSSCQGAPCMAANQSSSQERYSVCQPTHLTR